MTSCNLFCTKDQQLKIQKPFCSYDEISRRSPNIGSVIKKNSRHWQPDGWAIRFRIHRLAERRVETFRRIIDRHSQQNPFLSDMRLFDKSWHLPFLRPLARFAFPMSIGVGSRCICDWRDPNLSRPLPRRRTSTISTWWPACQYAASRPDRIAHSRTQGQRSDYRFWFNARRWCNGTIFKRSPRPVTPSHHSISFWTACRQLTGNNRRRHAFTGVYRTSVHLVICFFQEILLSCDNYSLELLTYAKK